MRTLVRKRPLKKDPHAMMNVGVHPELHKVIAHQALDNGQSIRERLHEILCNELDRLDLIHQAPDHVAASA